jgi:hypothetical protein
MIDDEVGVHKGTNSIEESRKENQMLVNKMGSTEGKSVSKHSIGRGWKLV